MTRIRDPTLRQQHERYKELDKAIRYRAAIAKRKLAAIKRATSKQLALQRYMQRRELAQKIKDTRRREKEARLLKRQLMRALRARRSTPIQAEIEASVYDRILDASLKQLEHARRQEVDRLQALYAKLAADGRASFYNNILRKLKETPLRQ